VGVTLWDRVGQQSRLARGQEESFEVADLC